MNAEDLLVKSDECFALARQGRTLADRLDAMGHSFMATAVALDTDVNRTKNREQKKNQE